jgi:hypothetical protein
VEPLTCWLCDGEVVPGEPVDFMVVGWERLRKQGGANQIKRRERLGSVAHPACVDGRVQEVTPEQALDLSLRYRGRVKRAE